MNLLEMLQQKIFTDSEQSAVDFILKDPESTLNMSIYQLAMISNSSASTIVRLCKKLGLQGYRTFKIRLSTDLAQSYLIQRTVDADLPFHKNDSDKMILHEIAKLTNESINQTIAYINETDLTYAVNLIHQAERLVGIGLRQCYIRLEDFQSKLLPIGKFIHLTHLQSEQVHFANNATKNDVAIIVSYSGTTAEIQNESQIFAVKGAKIIGITSNMNSPLAKFSTVILPIPVFEDLNFKVANFSSQIAIEYVFNVLYSCLYNRDFDKNYVIPKKGPSSSFLF